MKRTRDAGLKVLTSPPIFDVLYAWCSPGTLRRVARTCAGARQAVDNYLTHTLSINKLLTRFFVIDDVLAFRNLQARLEFVISGSQALQLLDRVVYPESDLDVYVFPLDGEVVGRWLLERGYEFIPQPHLPAATLETALATMPSLPENASRATQQRWEQYGVPSVRRVLNFKKRTPAGDPAVPLDADPTALKVQVIVALTAPLHTIVNFHATMSMNLVTWDRAVSLYPRATFEERRALVTYTKGAGFEDAMLKYAARGYRIDTHLFVEDTASGSAFAFGRRWVGDGQCWAVALDTAGITPPTHPLALEANCWELAYAPERDEDADFGQCAVHSACLRSIVFRHRYVVTDDFLAFLVSFLHKQGTVEARRLRDVGPGMSVAYGQPKPEGYTYWDTTLLRFKQSFLKQVDKL